MNDPHVNALYYRIKHADSVDFDKARPLEHEGPAFSVRIENDQAQIVMKEPHATAESARGAVEPFLKAWELKSALSSAADKFEFAFQNCDLIDRKPTPGVVYSQGFAVSVSISDDVKIRVGRASYPDPPIGLARDGATDLMFNCYSMYCDGRARLGDSAYFCLTVLEREAGCRKQAARYFGIANSVLNKLGALSDQKGGREARKAKGAQSEFTNLERTWLQDAMKIMIRRAAEVAFDPLASRREITLADLPSLAQS